MSSMSEEIKERIADLMKINLSHKNLNADLRKEIKYLKDRCDFYLIQLETDSGRKMTSKFVKL